MPNISSASPFEALPATPVEPYTPHDITRIIVNSFRFSRGAGSFQEAMIRVIATENSERFSDEVFDAATRPTIDAVQAIYFNPKLHIPTNQLDTRDEAVTQYIRRLRKDTLRPAPNKEDLYELCLQAIQADLNWVPGYDGDRSPRRHPFASNVAKFSLLGKTTGQAEFDDVYRVIGALLPVATKRSEHKAYFEESIPQVFRAHVKYNPSDGAALNNHPLMPRPRRSIGRLLGITKK